MVARAARSAARRNSASAPISVRRMQRALREARLGQPVAGSRRARPRGLGSGVAAGGGRRRISSSAISFCAQWIAPTPMRKIDTAEASGPAARLLRLEGAERPERDQLVGRDRDVARRRTRWPAGPTAGTVAATWRSARRAALGSMSVHPWRVRRERVATRDASCAGWPARGSACWCRVSLIGPWLRSRRGRRRCSATEADDPAEQALGHRAETSRGASRPGSAARCRCCDVRDDVALRPAASACCVGEHRHVLRAGQHGLVDVLRGRVHRGAARTCRASARRPRRRSCGTARSWCGTARRRRRGPRSVRSSCSSVGIAGPGPSEATYAASCGDLLVVVTDRLLAGPAAPGARAACGRCRPGSRRRRRRRRSGSGRRRCPGRQAVAGGAASRNSCWPASTWVGWRVGVGAAAAVGARRGVHAAGGHQREQEDDERRERWCRRRRCLAVMVLPVAWSDGVGGVGCRVAGYLIR